MSENDEQVCMLLVANESIEGKPKRNLYSLQVFVTSVVELNYDSVGKKVNELRMKWQGEITSGTHLKHVVVLSLVFLRKFSFKVQCCTILRTGEHPGILQQITEHGPLSSNAQVVLDLDTLKMNVRVDSDS